MLKLKTKVTDIVKKIDGLRESIKEQDKRIENQTIKASITNQENLDIVEQSENNNKMHLKETLNNNDS